MSNANNSKLNTLLGLLTLVVAVMGGAFYIAPLKTLPEDLKGVKGEVQDVRQTQAVQTEALKNLTEVARETNNLRRDLDKTSAESRANQEVQQLKLQNIQDRLEKLETPKSQALNP